MEIRERLAWLALHLAGRSSSLPGTGQGRRHLVLRWLSRDILATGNAFDLGGGCREEVCWICALGRLLRCITLKLVLWRVLSE